MSKQEKREIQGRPAPPDTRSWFEYSWRLQQDVPNRLEDAAKFLVTIISLTMAIIVTALDRIKAAVVQPFWVFIVLFLWLGALFFAFLVLFPRTYRFHSGSVDSIKAAHLEIIRTKQVRFILAAVLYFIPLLILAILYLISL